MQDIYFLDPVPHPIELLNEAECDDDWLAPLGFTTGKPSAQPEMRRTHSTPALATVSELKPETMGWPVTGKSTAPLPIRATRCSSVDLKNASLESAQTLLLGGSCPDNDSFLLESAGNTVRNGSMYQQMSGSAPVQQQFLNQHYSAMDTNDSLPQGWVPSSSLSAPSSATPMPIPNDVFGDDMRALDEALEMMSSGQVLPADIHYGGSCPLPTLLEDSISEDHVSDESVHHLGALSMDVDSSTSWLAKQPQMPTSTRIVIRRSAPRSVPGSTAQRQMERTVRNGTPVSGPSIGLLSASCPIDSNRPQRSAARRSLVVTAAALKEYDDGSDSDSDGQLAFTETVTRKGNGSVGKKKHNPWSLEETEALVSGVQMAGLGKWAEIKRLPVPAITEALNSRSAVDLKDKWRNLTRVARLPKAQLKARLARSASEVPLEMMLTVKSLMDNGNSGVMAD